MTKCISAVEESVFFQSAVGIESHNVSDWLKLGIAARIRLHLHASRKSADFRSRKHQITISLQWAVHFDKFFLYLFL